MIRSSSLYQSVSPVCCVDTTTPLDVTAFHFRIFRTGPGWTSRRCLFSFIKRRYSRSLTVSDLIDIVTSNHRFMLDVQLAREGELFAGKYRFLPVRIKAIQSHKRLDPGEHQHGVAPDRQNHLPRSVVHGRTPIAEGASNAPSTA